MKIFVLVGRAVGAFSKAVSGMRGCIGMTAMAALLGASTFACVLAPAATGEQETTFGIAGFSLQTTDAGAGSLEVPYEFTQAGGHPYALTSTLEFATHENSDGSIVSSGEVASVIIDLPAGLLANPQAVSRCAEENVVKGKLCPTDTQVGVAVLRASFEGLPVKLLEPIVNVTSWPGVPAVLGLEVPELETGFLLVGRVVHTTQGYTLEIKTSGLPALGVSSMQMTLWGVPASPAHDAQRGQSCTELGAIVLWSCEGGGVASGLEQVAFLTLGSDCAAGAPVGVAWANSWEEPSRYSRAEATLPRMTGCERLPFSPEIQLRAETSLAEAPVGANIVIKTHQSEGPATPAVPELRSATVTLPQNMSINPGVANGLSACQKTGPEGIDMPTGLDARDEPLQPRESGEGEEVSDGEPELSPGHCPAASTIGAVQASTPLLAHPIEGHMYLATPGCGGLGQAPCTAQDAEDGELYRFYIELRDRNTSFNEGVLIKIEGQLDANPATGQLTVKLLESPQLPINELIIHLYGGSDALLINPATCGPAITSAELEPWSASGTTPAPESMFVYGTPEADPSSYYDVTGCVTPPTLKPGFIAGSTNVTAGAFSPFVLAVTHNQGEQSLSGIQLHTPLGLSAMLSSVPPCEEAQANSGNCPPAARIGSSTVTAGAGPQPLYMPGSIYLTAGYGGAPFGLSIVTNADAGPLNLGAVVIRARIDIDPHTGALTITSNQLPQIVLGVPLRIQSIALDIDRPGFIVNPTDCDAQRVTATITGTQDSSTEVSNRYELANCAKLTFKPKLKASTSAHTSIADGASLDIKLTFPKTPQGTQANLARVKIALPKHLASRLTTLQSACPQGIFDANPAACPKASIIGTVRAQTTILSLALTGPVYLVSHGADTLPSPVLLLQGNGVTLYVTGSTTISDTGVTHVAFNTIPDVPMNNLELYLPSGPHSLLEATTNLCVPAKTITTKRNPTTHTRVRTASSTVKTPKNTPANLTIPTELAAQNDTIIHQNTKIEIVGCASSKRR